MPPSQLSKKQKIVILGGGAASMTAAFGLTSQPGWRDKYEITLYQMGWRLGGKGASGRNLDEPYHSRIEEHGVHIWFGLYDNAFRVMQRCYQELNRAPDAPLGTWDAAFKPHSFVVLEENVNGQWLDWPITMPTNDLVPGDNTVLLPLPEYFIMAIEFMRDLFAKSRHATTQAPAAERAAAPHPGLAALIEDLGHGLGDQTVNQGGKLIHAALQLAHSVHKEPEDAGRLLNRNKAGIASWLQKDLGRASQRFETHLAEAGLDIVADLLELFMIFLWQIVKDEIDTNAADRRLWLALNFAYGCLRGIVKDKILERGFDAIDDLEYRAWLGQYLMDDGGRTLNSPLTTGLYDALFAYQRGDLTAPNIAAGVALRTDVRLFLTYKGALMWKMQAGMGDTVFTPLYEVLKRRGVKFEFFHRVKQLTLSADKKSIASIKIGRQVTIKGNKDYEPLVDVKGLACWPSAPLYEQIVEADKLKNVNLESFCSPWKDVEEVRLDAGQHFDKVILGISLGAMPYICHDLIEANKDWRAMVKQVKTVRTQAFQMWLKPSAYQLGWTKMGLPILTAYDITPLDTWADMSHLIDHEDWPSKTYPLNIAYFCGPMKDDPPQKDETDLPCPKPEDYAPLAKAEAIAFLDKDLAHLWPRAVSPADKKFNWELLVDDRAGQHHGKDRFDSQYWRANVDPSERYVLSVNGSLKHRLKPGASGFTNLVITGDWTDNGFNIGCVEATVMSGMLASNAICGYPKLEDITGLNF